MDNVRGDRRKNRRQICRGKGRLYIARTPATKKVTIHKYFNCKKFEIAFISYQEADVDLQPDRQDAESS